MLIVFPDWPVCENCSREDLAQRTPRYLNHGRGTIPAKHASLSGDAALPGKNALPEPACGKSDANQCNLETADFGCLSDAGQLFRRPQKTALSRSGSGAIKTSGTPLRGQPMAAVPTCPHSLIKKGQRRNERRPVQSLPALVMLLLGRALPLRRWRTRPVLLRRRA